MSKLFTEDQAMRLSDMYDRIIKNGNRELLAKDVFVTPDKRKHKLKFECIHTIRKVEIPFRMSGEAFLKWAREVHAAINYVADRQIYDYRYE